VRSSVLRMVCGSRLPMKPPGGGLKTVQAGQMAKMPDPRNVVAFGLQAPRFSRFALPVPAAHRLTGEPRDPAPRNVVAPGCGRRALFDLPTPAAQRLAGEPRQA
jgi:hypothetical protein